MTSEQLSKDEFELVKIALLIAEAFFAKAERAESAFACKHLHQRFEKVKGMSITEDLI